MYMSLFTFFLSKVSRLSTMLLIIRRARAHSSSFVKYLALFYKDRHHCNGYTHTYIHWSCLMIPSLLLLSLSLSLFILNLFPSQTNSYNTGPHQFRAINMHRYTSQGATGSSEGSLHT